MKGSHSCASEPAKEEETQALILEPIEQSVLTHSQPARHCDGIAHLLAENGAKAK